MSDERQYAMIDAELYDALQDSFERHKVPKRARARLLTRFDETITEVAMLENVRKGLMDVSGIDREGEALFRLTPGGKTYVERMLPAAKK